MKHITADAFREVIDTESSNQSVDFINVCTPVEYKEKHITGVRSVPLDELEHHLSEFRDKKTIYVHCRSGNRSTRAIEKLVALGVKAELVNVHGGLMAWDAAGFRTMSLTNRLPIMRQTLLAAGLLVVIGVLLALFVHSSFAFLSLAIGFGLAFAGLTGWCGMSFFLSKMPWNR